MKQKAENANKNNIIQIAGDNHGNIYINTAAFNRLTQEQFHALALMVETIEAAREVAGTPLSDKQIWSYLYRAMGVTSYDELTADQYSNAARYLMVSLQKCVNNK